MTPSEIENNIIFAAEKQKLFQNCDSGIIIVIRRIWKGYSKGRSISRWRKEIITAVVYDHTQKGKL